MKKRLSVISIIMMIALIVLASCSGTPEREATAEDIAILTEIGDALTSTISKISSLADYCTAEITSTGFTLTFTKDYSGTSDSGSYTIKAGTVMKQTISGDASSGAYTTTYNGSIVISDGSTHTVSYELVTSYSSSSVSYSYSVILDGTKINVAS